MYTVVHSRIQWQKSSCLLPTDVKIINITSIQRICFAYRCAFPFLVFEVRFLGREKSKMEIAHKHFQNWVFILNQNRNLIKTQF